MVVSAHLFALSLKEFFYKENSEMREGKKWGADAVFEWLDSRKLSSKYRWHAEDLLDEEISFPLAALVTLVVKIYSNLIGKLSHTLLNAPTCDYYPDIL